MRRGIGGRPADPRSVEEQEELVYGLLDPAGAAVSRPHEDPDPGRRVARRILQRLNGMGKWGGYHTDFAHLARGFAGNDRALAHPADLQTTLSYRYAGGGPDGRPARTLRRLRPTVRPAPVHAGVLL